MKIASKIGLGFFILVSILFIIGAVPFYIVAKKDLLDSIYNHLTTAAASRTEHIETYLKAQEESAANLAQSIVFRNLLTVSEKDADYVFKFNQALTRIKGTQQELTKYIFEISLLDRQGKSIISSDENRIGVDWSNDACFLGGSKATYIEDAYYSEATGRNSIDIASPIKDNQSGEFLGVVVCRVSLNALNKITTERTGLGKTGEIYVVNKYGYMITPSRFIKDTFLKQKVDTENVRNVLLHKTKEHVLHSNNLINIFLNYRGMQVLGVHEYLPQMHWGVLAEIETKEAFAPLFRLWLVFLGIIIIIPFVAWLIGMYIGKFITLSLHELHKGTEIIGNGNLDYKVGTDVKDEVGQLSRAFDKMTADLKMTTVSVSLLEKEVNERKSVEKELRESELYLRSILDSIKAGFMLIHADSHEIIDVNAAAINMFGAPKENIIGSICHQFICSAEAGKCPITDLGQLVENSECVLLNAKGEKVPIIKNVVSIMLSGYRYLLESFVEITERKRAEEALKSAYEQLKATQLQLVQSSKMATVGLLAGGVAHEINNPLTGVLNNVQLIKMEAADKKDFSLEDFKQLLDIIEESALRCVKITRSLLEFSHVSKGMFEPLYLNEMVEKSTILIAHEFKLQNITIQKDLQPDLPLILGDFQLLQQVVFDFISNSKWAIEKKSDRVSGTITIKTQYETGKNEVCLFISDSGIGIPKENLEKIFEPFFSTKEVGQGTGLGLSIIYGIVSAHRGKITVESEVGVGTTFKVNLPVISEMK